MEDEQDDKRQRIKALVREILAAVPVDETPSDTLPERVVVNSLREKAAREWDRDESAKSLITEDDLRGLEPGSRVRVSDSAKFTPLAHDIIKERDLTLVRKTQRAGSLVVTMVAIGADHGGYAMKEQLKTFLSGLGVSVRDFGTNSTEAVDYPDLAHLVARAVSEGHVEAGIMIDGAGIGSSMAANKVPGVRAAACYSVALAKNSREHNGANVLTLGSSQNSFEEVCDIAEAWLSTEITEPRHKVRVAKIGGIESQYKRC